VTLAIETEPSPSEVQILSCRYPARCRARSCGARAMSIARYLDGVGVFVRQYELCQPHSARLIVRDAARGIVVNDHR
jgi:hypothetical protein